MPLNCELDEPVNQFRQWNAARLPEHRVHADRRKPGNRVDLVQQQPLGTALKEEIDPRHARQIERPERPDCDLLHFRQLAPVRGRRG